MRPAFACLAGIRPRSMTRLAVLAPAVLAVSLVVVGGCGQPQGHDPGPRAATPGSTPAPRSIAFQLYTHCGIDEARIGTTYYEAVPRLDDGHGNPPNGWGNPYQDGTMTVTSNTTAVFTDQMGHRVEFHSRPGATSFKQICS